MFVVIIGFVIALKGNNKKECDSKKEKKKKVLFLKVSYLDSLHFTVCYYESFILPEHKITIMYFPGWIKLTISYLFEERSITTSTSSEIYM